MKFKRFLFVFVILAISLSCYRYMNKEYDPLARYPYSLTTEQHDLITANLDQKEIEYLIEYAIAPENYIDFLAYDGFNIYLINEYDQMYTLYSGVETREMIMRLVNCTNSLYTEEEVKILLSDYYFYEIVDFYEDGNTEILAANVASLSFYFTDAKSIGYYSPKDLELIDLNTMTDHDIYIRAEANSALTSLYQAVKAEFTKTYKTLSLTDGYLSYQVLSERYKETKNTIYQPGHSEFQLGLVIDFDSAQVDTEILTWLNENAYLYGFIQIDQDQLTDCYRYVGVDLAKILYTDNLSLAEYYHE